MKLNLGCNEQIMPGYTNIDKDNYPGVDLIGDVSRLDLADGCVDEIFASHILEHFHHAKTLEILKEWYRLLSTDGILKLAVPDFDRAIEIYRERGLCDWVVNYLWGDQGYDGANHYCGFNEERLTKILKEAGFNDISRAESLPGSNPSDCSNLVSDVDNRLVSLNMICVK